MEKLYYRDFYCYTDAHPPSRGGGGGAGAHATAPVFNGTSASSLVLNGRSILPWPISRIQGPTEQGTSA